MGPGNGVSFAVSETAVQLANDPNALAVWYASMMGEFMNHGVEYFSPWGWDKGMWETLHLYSRYNKNNSIRATSGDELNVSAYATANDSNDSVTVALVNRSLTQAKTVIVNLSNFVLPGQAVQTLTLSGLPAGTETFVSHTNNALQSANITPLNSSGIQVVLAPKSITSLLLARSSAALPMDLLSFSAAKSGEGVQLHFTTSHEQNAASFEIDRSADGVTYAAIGSVAAAAGNLKNDYSFYDTHPLASANYYRLKMIDRDGGYSYSRIVSLAFDRSSLLSVFPNPAIETLNVQCQLPAGQVLLDIYDAGGRRVETVRLQSAGSLLATSIDIRGLTKGLYYIKAGGEKLSFVKQ